MKSFILFCLLAIPSMAQAQNYFADGMTWKAMVGGTQDPEFNPTLETTTIDGDTIVGGQQALKMYQSCGDADNELVAIVRTEGDKVFFRDENSATGWSLCYDFGLETGEGCYIKSIGSPHISTYIKCVGICDDPEYNGWAVMELEEYEDETCAIELGKGKWLRGLCSSIGVTRNNRLEMDGIGAWVVIEVSNGKQLLYQNLTNGISGATERQFGVSVDGMSVNITGIDAASGVSLFSNDGRMQQAFSRHTGSVKIQLPRKGVYILKVGNHVRKIMAF